MSETLPYWKQRQQHMLNGTRPESSKRKKVKVTLTSWFAEHLEKAPAKCEMCGDHLIHSIMINPRSIVCHILAKKLYPAVATASENRFFGCNACHTKYDSASSDEIKEMPLYPVLVERTKTFYHLITETDKKSIPACFRLDSKDFVMPKN